MSSLKMKERVATKITTEIYNSYVDIFSNPKPHQGNLISAMTRIKQSVTESVFVQDGDNLEKLEKLLIALLGNE